MTLELRVLSGARAGVREQFTKSVVAIGRHPTSDFRFDATQDLDVSTRHAELRGIDGAWILHDVGSTNGTFVNGERIPAPRAIRDGDVLGFGANGPQLEIRVIAQTPVDQTPVVQAPLFPASAAPALAAPAAVMPAAMPAVMPVAIIAEPVAPAAALPRRDTSVRIAEAVGEQARRMQRNFALALVGVLVAGVGAFAWWNGRSNARELELLQVIARSESASSGLERAIAEMRPRDSIFAALLSEQAASAKRAASDGRAMAAGRTAATSQSVTQLSRRLDRATQVQRSIVAMDFSRVHDANDAAVAMIASDLDGTFVAGTAFGVSRSGLLVTNRHVVRTESGQPARRVRVIFGNTTEWIPAHVVRMSETDDLALLQLDVAGRYPVVAGISRDGALARVGAPVASIGYPHAIDTPMEGSGLHVTARTSTTAGTVSKRLDDVIQIDSYAGKGSSGSPLFDTNGQVVGVIYGGAAESNGRIVYAVPAQRLAGFLGEAR